MINEAVLRLNLINASGMSIRTIEGETRSLDVVGIGENGLTGFVIEDGQLIQIEGVIIGSAEKQDRVRRQQHEQLHTMIATSPFRHPQLS